MSLICGILSFRDKNLASLEALAPIMAASEHRAIDGEATFFDHGAGLAVGYGHTATFGNEGRPLAWHVDDDYVAGIDGDVYNADVQSRDRQFANPHVGAVVSRYDGDPDHLCRGLDGYFAFFLWDRRRRTLHLASDPLNHKFLYYYHDQAQGLLVFSTEMKGVLASALVPREVDRRVIPLYLGRGLVDPPLTLVKGVRKFSAGQHITYGSDGVQSERYWRPTLTTGPADFDFWKDRLRSQLLAASGRTAAGASKIGVFLSGGMDSSIVLAALRTQGSSEVTAFTLAYDDPDSNDDVLWARRVARQTHSPHETVVVDSERQVTPEVLATVLRQLDEPFDASLRAWNEYFLCSAASELGYRSILNGAITSYGPFISPGVSAEPDLNLSWEETIAKTQARLRGFTRERMEAALGYEPDLSVMQEPWTSDLEVIEGLEAPQATAMARLLNAAIGRGSLFHQFVPPLLGVDERSLYSDSGAVQLDISQPRTFTGLETSTTVKSMFNEVFRDVLQIDFLTERERKAYPELPFPSWLNRVLVPSLKPLADDGIVRADYLDWLERRFHEKRHRAWLEAWMWFNFSCWYQYHVKRTDPFNGLDI